MKEGGYALLFTRMYHQIKFLNTMYLNYLRIGALFRSGKGKHLNPKQRILKKTNRARMAATCLALGLAGVTPLFAQTGPGGTGDNSTLSLWLRADDYSSGTWNDWSNNNLDGTSPSTSEEPTHSTNDPDYNGRDVLSFDGSNDVVEVSDHASLNEEDFTVFCVGQYKINPGVQNWDPFLVKTGNAGWTNGWGLSHHDPHEDMSAWYGHYNTNLARVNTIDEVPMIMHGTYVYQDQVSLHVDRNLLTTSTGLTSTPGNSNKLMIGNAFNGTGPGYPLDGKIAEAIVFGKVLNEAEAIIVSNYLSTRYGIALINDDYYTNAYENTHGEEVIGIGRESSTDIQDEAIGRGIVYLENPSALSDGDYLLIGHNVSTITAMQTTNLPTDFYGLGSRLVREWRATHTGDAGTVDVTFHLDGTGFDHDEYQYQLLIDSDGDFTSGATKHITGRSYDPISEELTFTDVSLADGDYFTLAAGPSVLHVDITSTCGTGCNGSNWTLAFDDLQDALDVAGDHDQIWVADGTYKPSKDINGILTSNLREATFLLVDKVDIYGAFSGNETQISDRPRNGSNVLTQQTILSGDVNIVGNQPDNCFHVVYGTGLTGSSEINGLIIEGGYIASSDNTPHTGAGIYLTGSTLTINECLVRDNELTATGTGGGGIGAVSNSKLIMDKNMIRENEAVSPGGGGLLLDATSEGFLTNITFLDNTAWNTTSGGGAFLGLGDLLEMQRCYFIENTSEGVGGAVRLQDHGQTSLVESCVFLENYAELSGGGMQLVDADPMIMNIVFNQNDASDDGGGGIEIVGTTDTEIFNCTFRKNGSNSGDGGGLLNSGTGNVGLTNNIFWDNWAVSDDDVSGVSTSDASHCFTQGFADGINDCFAGSNSPFALDHLPTDLDGVDNRWLTEDDGLNLSEDASPWAIDKGFNGAIPLGITNDIKGDPRVNALIVDIGAYEYGECFIDDIVYVDHQATGDETGGCWEHAFTTLPQAFEFINNFLGQYPNVVEVRVAQGTYYASKVYAPGQLCCSYDRDPGDRLEMVSGVSVRGGYDYDHINEIETYNINTLKATVSGEINNTGLLTDNTRNIFWAFGVSDDTELSGFIIEDGYSGGSNQLGGAAIKIIGNSGTTSELVVKNCTIQDNQHVQGGIIHHGGAVDCYGYAHATFEDVVFDGNKTTNASGGAVNITVGSHPTFTNCTFENNEADNGKGGAVKIDNYCNPVFNTCTFDLNTAELEGGAVHIDGETQARFNECAFTSNSSESDGGVASMHDLSMPIFDQCTFESNTSDQNGGVLYADDGAFPEFTYCSFTSNEAEDHGGVIYLSDGSHPSIVNCVFEGNEATLGSGGVIYTLEARPEVTGSVFYNNTSYTAGGAVCATTSGTYTSGDPLFRNTFNNCTFLANQSQTAEGGAIYGNYTDAFVYVHNCIFQVNTSSGGGISLADGEIYSDNSATVYLTNCITEDFAPSHPSNLAPGTSPGFVNMSDPDGPNNDFFDALAGLTLASGSAAINEGNNAYIPSLVTTDLADAVRLQKGKIDIGAYESATGTQWEKYPTDTEDLQDFQGCPQLSIPSEYDATMDDFVSVVGLQNGNATKAFLYAMQWLQDVDGPNHRTRLTIDDDYEVGLQLAVNQTVTCTTETITVNGTDYYVDPPDPTNPTGGPRLLGVNVMDIVDVENVTVTGDGNVTVYFEDNSVMYYGAFDQSFVPSLVFSTADLTNPGLMVNVDECDCVELSNVRLHGSFDEFNLGTANGGVILADYDGVVIHNSTRIALDDVISTSFGRDGITVMDSYPEYTEDVVIRDSRFEWNARQGISWTGGDLLRVTNSFFGHTGILQNGFNNGHGAGIDLELHQSDAITEGYFRNCESVDNHKPALAIGSQGISHWPVGGFEFDHCVFWSDEDDHYTLWMPQTKHTRFVDCSVYGDVNFLAGSGPYDRLAFERCYFSDRGPDGQKAYQQGPRFLDLSSSSYDPLDPQDLFYSFSECTFDMHDSRLIDGGAPITIGNEVPIWNNWECNTMNFHTEQIVQVPPALNCQGGKSWLLINELNNANFFSNTIVDKNPVDPSSYTLLPMDCDNQTNVTNSFFVEIYPYTNQTDGQNVFLPISPGQNMEGRIWRHIDDTNYYLSSFSKAQF